MKALHILLVEDNEGDILLTTEALEETKMNVRLSIAKDGNQAIEFMKSKANAGREDIVNLVLLDINLPKRNGHEVLKYIKENKHLKDTPVIMLTTSSFAKDIQLAQKHGADNYLVKPVDAEQLLAVVVALNQHSNKAS